MKDFQAQYDEIRKELERFDEDFQIGIKRMLSYFEFNPDDFVVQFTGSGVEFREAENRWNHFDLYHQQRWSGDVWETSLSASGTTYKEDNKPGFKLLMLQGIVASQMLEGHGGILGLVQNSVVMRKYIEGKMYKVLREKEAAEEEQEEKEKAEYLETVKPLLIEGGVFCENTSTRRGPEHDYYKIEKVTDKTVKGSGGSETWDGEKRRMRFYGEFWNSRTQIDKETLLEGFWNRGLGFCSLLPEDHPVTVAVATEKIGFDF